MFRKTVFKLFQSPLRFLFLQSKPIKTVASLLIILGGVTAIPLSTILRIKGEKSLHLNYEEGVCNTSECEKGDQNSNNFRLFSNVIADVVAIVSPAVVNIIVPVEGYMSMGANSGSGFIISHDGFIVTNAHVVAEPRGIYNTKVIITMSDTRRMLGTLHSFDFVSDIALIKIDDLPPNEVLPTVTFGRSGKTRAGEFAIAIGSPMQLQNSASLGIISATARHASEIGLSNNRSEYLQTDAAINVGNSGGPLVNLNGEVIGINTMKVKGTDGISFAIPIDAAVQVIEQLKFHKKVIRPFVGLKMANFIDTTNEKSNRSTFFRSSPRSSPSNGMMSMLDETKVVIVEVVKDSPAAKAGIKSGDVISEVNGKVVKDVRDVLNAIGMEVGITIEFKLTRSNGSEEMIRLITAPESSSISH